MTTFADQYHLERVRQRLWSNREYGRAAVLVGAGFSRNAESITPGATFPDWRQLADGLYDGLYPPHGLTLDGRKRHERERREATAGGGVLRIASEYETAFGRADLDALIRRLVPDDDYRPGRLHELLLSLPWSDIFTTNYDTLLERAGPAVHERKYDLILSPADLPGAMRPRIVKLHGSFPAQRPFVATEEDFRAYPTRCAPFVTLVTESLMENALVLIGFSGDDPNFLAWSGWVRDQLGPHAPTIYLCGMLRLTAPRHRLLERRGVIPIDLSPLFQPRGAEDTNRHADALEWLLLNLLHGAPPSTVHWPTPARRAAEAYQPSRDLPRIPDGPPPLTEPLSFNPDHGGHPDTWPQHVLDRWRRQHQEYPGWVVAPQANREALWQGTKYYVEAILACLPTLAAPDSLALAYELNWRLETALVPLLGDWADRLAATVEQYVPFPRRVGLPQAPYHPDSDAHAGFDWPQVGAWWVELAFAVLRAARESHNEDRFEQWRGRLDAIVGLNADWRARLCYEVGLWHINRLDHGAVRAALTNWPAGGAAPFWDAKRAALLAEIGDIQEAEPLAERALAGIRRRLQPYQTDRTLLSQEGWTLRLIDLIKRNPWGQEWELAGQARDRWEQLLAHRCDPRIEVALLQATLTAPPPAQPVFGELRRGFDPGSAQRHFTTRSGPPFDPALPAYALLRLAEVGGLPLYCGSISIYSASFASAAAWIAPWSSLWGIATLLRTRQTRVATPWFSRDRIANFDTATVAHFSAILERAVREALGADPVDEGALLFALELLSRLSFRLDRAALERLCDLAIALYRAPGMRATFGVSAMLGTLFARLFLAMDLDHLATRLPDIFALPLPHDSGDAVAMPDDWPEPSVYLSGLPGMTMVPLERARLSALIPHLLALVAGDNHQARWRASVRLGALMSLGMLTPEERDSLGKKLWAQVDLATGLPAATRSLPHAFLALPQPESGIAAERLRSFLLGKELAAYHTGDGAGWQYDFPDSNASYLKTLLTSTMTPLHAPEQGTNLIAWPPDEADRLLLKLVRWWDADGVGTIGAPAEIREAYGALLPVLARVVIPWLAPDDRTSRNSTRRLLDEMGAAEYPVARALPLALRLDGQVYDRVIVAWWDAFLDEEEGQVAAAIGGLLDWLLYRGTPQGSALPEPPTALLGAVVQQAATRRQPGLDTALEMLALVAEHRPASLDYDARQLLVTGLGHLLRETDRGRYDTATATAGTRPGQIPPDDRPRYRALAATLALHLADAMQQSDRRLDPIFDAWREATATDPLPEIRRIWLGRSMRSESN